MTRVSLIVSRKSSLSTPTELAVASASITLSVCARMEIEPPTVMSFAAKASAPPCITPIAMAAPRAISVALLLAVAVCVAVETCWADTVRSPVMVDGAIVFERFAVVRLSLIIAATAAPMAVPASAPALDSATVSYWPSAVTDTLWAPRMTTSPTLAVVRKTLELTSIEAPTPAVCPAWRTGTASEVLFSEASAATVRLPPLVRVSDAPSPRKALLEPSAWVTATAPETPTTLVPTPEIDSASRDCTPSPDMPAETWMSSAKTVPEIDAIVSDVCTLTANAAAIPNKVSAAPALAKAIESTSLVAVTSSVALIAVTVAVSAIAALATAVDRLTAKAAAVPRVRLPPNPTAAEAPVPGSVVGGTGAEPKARFERSDRKAISAATRSAASVASAFAPWTPAMDSARFSTSASAEMTTAPLAVTVPATVAVAASAARFKAIGVAIASLGSSPTKAAASLRARRIFVARWLAWTVSAPPNTIVASASINALLAFCEIDPATVTWFRSSMAPKSFASVPA